MCVYIIRVKMFMLELNESLLETFIIFAILYLKGRRFYSSLELLIYIEGFRARGIVLKNI